VGERTIEACVAAIAGLRCSYRCPGTMDEALIQYDHGAAGIGALTG
jgi:hypothetical protein